MTRKLTLQSRVALNHTWMVVMRQCDTITIVCQSHLNSLSVRTWCPLYNIYYVWDYLIVAMDRQEPAPWIWLYVIHTQTDKITVQLILVA